MDIRIAGGHGQVARLLARHLSAIDDTVHGIIRSADQVGDIEADGAQAIVLDLESATTAELAEALRGADAVVFAAGAGAGSGAERKWTVDHGGAAKLREAAVAAGVSRYVMVSSMGTDDPPTDDEVFSVYLRAKARADEELMASDLEWTVVRPGRLEDGPGTGAVTLGRHVDRGGIPRDDVAAVLAACLHDDRTIGHVLEVVGGEIPITTALDALVS